MSQAGPGLERDQSYRDLYAPPSAEADEGVVPIDYADDDRPLARPDARLFAAMADWFLYVIAVFVGWLVFGTVFFTSMSMRGLPALVGLSILPGLLAFPLVCFQWYLISTRGQTIGKRLLNIRIVKMDGSPVGFGSGVVLRSWSMDLIVLVPVIGPLVRLLDILFIFGQESRCIHDLIAGTRVIELPAQGESNPSPAGPMRSHKRREHP